MFSLIMICYTSLFSLIICQKFLPYTCECYGSFMEENFNFKKFSGTWYVHSYIPNKFGDQPNCIAINYAQITKSKFLLSRKMYMNRKVIQEVKGTLWVPYVELNAGYFQITYDGSPSTQMAYSVLRTDYTFYAVVWECKNVGSKSMSFIWVLTKNNTLPKKYFYEVERALKKNRLDLKGVTYLGSSLHLCSENEESLYF